MRAGQTLARLRNAILEGFDRPSLDHVLQYNDMLRQNIADGPDFASRVDSLIRVAQREGWITNLCGTLAEERKSNTAVYSAIVAVQTWLTERRETIEAEPEFLPPATLDGALRSLPTIDRMQGDIIINVTGASTAGISPAQIQQIVEGVQAGRSMPPELFERYEQLAQRFGVTEAALTTFFRILGERSVPIEDLDAKLREVADRHLTLLQQPAPVTGEHPKVDALRKEADAAIDVGEYDRAETLLEQACEADIDAARDAQDAANRRLIAAASSKSKVGDLKLSELQYEAAARAFQEASDLVPASEPLFRADYLCRSGTAAITAGLYTRAADALSESLRIREELLDPDDTDVAISLSELGWLYRVQGRLAEAGPLLERALTIGEKALDQEHADIGTYLNNLALLYWTQGRYAEAGPLYERTLSIKEKQRGPEHAEVGIALLNLALLYGSQGRYTEAESLCRRALAIDEKELGANHPEVGNSLQVLAGLCQSQERYDDAEPLFNRALTISEKALGPEHPDVGTRVSGLATLYRLQGRYDEAEPLCQRALAIAKGLGPEHPQVGICINNLAVLYASQGRFDEAEPLFKDALVIGEKALGVEHPDVGKYLNSLAVLYEEQGRYAEAEPLYKRALVIYEKVFGPDHPNTATVRDNLKGCSA